MNYFSQYLFLICILCLLILVSSLGGHLGKAPDFHTITVAKGIHYKDITVM